MNNIFRIKKKYFGAEDWKTLEQLILHFWFLYTFSIIESKNADFIMFFGKTHCWSNVEFSLCCSVKAQWISKNCPFWQIYSAAYVLQ